jgi:hypothetical protein
VRPLVSPRPEPLSTKILESTHKHSRPAQNIGRQIQ